MAPWVKVLAAKPAHLSLATWQERYMVGENRLLEVVFRLPCALAQLCTYTQINKCNTFKVYKEMEEHAF